MATIKWVEIEFRGPYCGVAQWENQEVWFRRLNLESSTYGLYRIPEEARELIEQDHQDLCSVSGNPLLHGDPRRVKTTKVVRSQVDTTATELELGNLQAMTNTSSHVYRFNTETLTDLITKINEEDFTNFRVPQPVIFVSE